MSISSLFGGAARIINSVTGSNIDVDTARDLGEVAQSGLNIAADVKRSGLSAFETGGAQDLQSYLSGGDNSFSYMSQTFMDNLGTSIMGPMTRDQLEEILANTPMFYNSSPEVQRQLLVMINDARNQAFSQIGSGLTGSGRSGGGGSGSGSGGGGIASPSGTFGASPGVGPYGTDSANSGNMDALKNFLLMKGMASSDVDAAMNSPDPSSRLALWGNMMTFNEQNQKLWFDVQGSLIKIYGEMGSSAAQRLGQV